MKQLISAKPCVWDVTDSYLAKDQGNISQTPNKLKFLQSLPTVGKPAGQKIKTVVLNGDTMVFQLDEERNEYFHKNGQSLTNLMVASAAGKGNRVQIY